MIQIPLMKELTALARLFDEAGVCLYAVGGMVRNPLLGYEQTDIDVASEMHPQDVLALCERSGIDCVPKALDFGTVEILLEHDGQRVGVEHTTFRGERYGAGGTHRPESVTLGASLAADAFRRDFSVNALYYDILGGTVSDPTGGMDDLEKHVLRATSKDPLTILRDDGLRVMRLVRFACELDFAIDPNTWQAAKACAKGLGDIAFERKRDELNKILLCDARYAHLDRPCHHAQPLREEELVANSVNISPVLRGLYLLLLLDAYTYLIPELNEGAGILQRKQYHAYPVLEHALHACACTPPELTLRLAGLLHDVGKPEALRRNTPEGMDWKTAGTGEKGHGKSTMLGHDAISAEMIPGILTRLRYPKTIIANVTELAANHMYDLTGMAKESTMRTRFAKLGSVLSEQLCAIREADVRGSGYEHDYVAARWRSILEKMRSEGAPFSEKELNCTGADIMRWLNIGPGEQVGEVKTKLLLHCARHPKDNTPARLSKVVQGLVHRPPEGN